MRKKIALISLLGIIVLVLGKDAIATFSLNYFLKKNLSVQAHVVGVSLTPRSITLKLPSISGKKFSFSAGSITVVFHIGIPFKPAVTDVLVTDAFVSVEDLQELQKVAGGFNAKFNSPRAQPENQPAPPPLHLAINRADIVVNQPDGISFHAHASLDAVFQDARIVKLTTLGITDCDVIAKNFSLVASLRQMGGNQYVLLLPAIKFKDKEIKDVSLFFETQVEKNTLVLLRSALPFLGEQASLEGSADFSNGQAVCLSLKAAAISSEALNNLLGGNQAVAVVGPFSGETSLCLGAQGITSIQSSLDNSGGGSITILNEAPLTFLHQYLEDASYNALVDSLKNYTYNEGKIAIASQQDVVAVHLQFDSQERGTRDISITLHNILGGAL